MKRLGVFLEQEQAYMRKNKPSKFYFLKGGRKSATSREEDSNANDVT